MPRKCRETRGFEPALAGGCSAHPFCKSSRCEAFAHGRDFGLPCFGCWLKTQVGLHQQRRASVPSRCEHHINLVRVMLPPARYAGKAKSLEISTDRDSATYPPPHARAPCVNRRALSTTSPRRPDRLPSASKSPTARRSLATARPSSNLLRSTFSGTRCSRAAIGPCPSA